MEHNNNLQMNHKKTEESWLMMDVLIFTEKVKNPCNLCKCFQFEKTRLCLGLGLFRQIQICLLIPILIESWARKETKRCWKQKPHLFSVDLWYHKKMLQMTRYAAILYGYKINKNILFENGCRFYISFSYLALHVVVLGIVSNQWTGLLYGNISFTGLLHQCDEIPWFVRYLIQQIYQKQTSGYFIYKDFPDRGHKKILH